MCTHLLESIKSPLLTCMDLSELLDTRLPQLRFAVVCASFFFSVINYPFDTKNRQLFVRFCSHFFFENNALEKQVSDFDLQASLLM